MVSEHICSSPSASPRGRRTDKLPLPCPAGSTALLSPGAGTNEAGPVPVLLQSTAQHRKTSPSPACSVPKVLPRGICLDPSRAMCS